MFIYSPRRSSRVIDGARTSPPPEGLTLVQELQAAGADACQGQPRGARVRTLDGAPSPRARRRLRAERPSPSVWVANIPRTPQVRSRAHTGVQRRLHLLCSAAYHVVRGHVCIFE